MKRVCLFCGSSRGGNPKYVEATRELIHAMAERGIGLVYGGAKGGLMGIAANTAVSLGVEVTGVIPQALIDLELGHQQLSRLHIVNSMHERKALMAELSDGWIALPGGFGTLDELCETVTWAQLGLHVKPCGLLNVSGFFDMFIAHINRAVQDNFIRPEHASLLLTDTEAGALLHRMKAFRAAPAVPKWLESNRIP